MVTPVSRMPLSRDDFVDLGRVQAGHHQKQQVARLAAGLPVPVACGPQSGYQHSGREGVIPTISATSSAFVRHRVGGSFGIGADHDVLTLSGPKGWDLVRTMPIWQTGGFIPRIDVPFSFTSPPSRNSAIIAKSVVLPAPFADQRYNLLIDMKIDLDTATTAESLCRPAHHIAVSARHPPFSSHALEQADQAVRRQLRR